MKLREILLSAGVEDIMHTNGTPPTRCLKATESALYPKPDATASQQLAKLRHGKACVTHNPAHNVGVHGIVSGNREDAYAIGHDDVLSLPDNSKASFLQSSQGFLMIDTGDFRQI
jgi:hypothetical protein